MDKMRPILVRFKSRKFLMALATMLLIILNEMIGLNIPSEAYWAIILPVIAFILGESFVDANK